MNLIRMKLTHPTLISILFLLFVTMTPAFPKVIVPSVFSDHMVLQQKSEVTLWGWARPHEPVIITTSWNDDTIKTVGDYLANWNVKIQTPAAGGPYTMKISGFNEIVIKDIFFGEVWFCSGQSNMEWSASWGIDNSEEEIKNADYPEIRFFNVPQKTSDSPQTDVDANWEKCTPQTMAQFSAVAYFFGQKLHNDLNVPVGLINSSWGGTPAEVWVNPNVIFHNEELSATANKQYQGEWAPTKPGKAYHAMIYPIIPYRIAGAIWYQGETNVTEPLEYTSLLTALIKSWREKWGYEFPFYYVQIAPLIHDKPFSQVLLREAQRLALTTPKTGMVVISDIGNINDIHPKNKKEVGLRLANMALNKTYGRKNLPFSGPLYKNMAIEGDSIRIFFFYADNGLICRGDELTYFEIASKNKKFFPAKAKIDGNTVIVYSDKVKKPVAVRFGWVNEAEPNLFNKEELPASCFRTDNWKIKL